MMEKIKKFFGWKKCEDLGKDENYERPVIQFGPPPYKLSKLQRIFTYLFSRLIEHAYRSGYELTLGEAYRTKEQADIYALKGKGIKNSLHRSRLAIDLNLWIYGKYQTKGESYRALGEYWESLSTKGVECCWGGRFSDGNHFSISFGGRK
jgi:hypothetical protein